MPHTSRYIRIWVPISKGKVGSNGHEICLHHQHEDPRRAKHWTHFSSSWKVSHGTPHGTPQSYQWHPMTSFMICVQYSLWLQMCSTEVDDRELLCESCPKGKEELPIGPVSVLVFLVSVVLLTLEIYPQTSINTFARLWMWCPQVVGCVSLEVSPSSFERKICP